MFRPDFPHSPSDSQLLLPTAVPLCPDDEASEVAQRLRDFARACILVQGSNVVAFTSFDDANDTSGVSLFICRSVAEVDLLDHCLWSSTAVAADDKVFAFRCLKLWHGRTFGHRSLRAGMLEHANRSAWLRASRNSP